MRLWDLANRFAADLVHSMHGGPVASAFLAAGNQRQAKYSATRGAQYRDDQLAGVDNSQQPARGEPRCGGQSGVNQAGDTHYLGNGQPSKLRARLRYTEHGSFWEVTHGVSHPALSVAFSLDQLLWAAGVRARQSLRQGGALQYTGPRQILTNGGW